MAFSVSVARAVAFYLRNQRIAPAGSLTQVLNPVGSPTSGVSRQAMHTVIEECRSQVPSDVFGLQVGAAVPLTKFHVLYATLQSCSTLRSALTLLSLHQELLSDGLRVCVEENGGLAVVQISNPPPGVRLPEFEAGLLIAVLIRLVRSFVSDAAGLRVAFQHRASAELSLYAALCGCIVCFEQASSTLQMPASWLDLVNIHCDPDVNSALLGVVETELHQDDAPRDTVTQLRNLLAGTASLSDISLGICASQLGMSPRSLKKKLHHERSTFTHLLGEERRRRAEHYLRAGLTISQVASRTGFSETSAFTRAFKRWTGKCPSHVSARADPARPVDARVARVGSSVPAT